MFQPSVETMPAEERAALPQQRLGALVKRLKSSDNPYWQQKLAGEGDPGHARAGLERRLADRLRVRVVVSIGPPGSIPRQETGKALRVWERTSDAVPFRA